jgi:hypothetical protein
MASTLRARLDRTFKQLICQMVAAAAAVIALFFFSLAAYSFFDEGYGAIVASLVLAGAYLVVALAALIWLRLLRRRETSRDAAPASAAQLLQDPIVVSSGLELLRVLGSRKAAPIAVLLAGVLIAASRFNPKSRPSRSGSKADS